MVMIFIQYHFIPLVSIISSYWLMSCHFYCHYCLTSQVTFQWLMNLCHACFLYHQKYHYQDCFQHDYHDYHRQQRHHHYLYDHKHLHPHDHYWHFHHYHITITSWHHQTIKIIISHGCNKDPRTRNPPFDSVFRKSSPLPVFSVCLLCLKCAFFELYSSTSWVPDPVRVFISPNQQSSIHFHNLLDGST